MNPRHFSQHRAENATGLDDPILIEPVDLSAVPPTDYPKHEGAPVMYPPGVFTWIETHGFPNNTEACSTLEDTFESFYGLAGTGWGITWDTRDNSGRLIKL